MLVALIVLVGFVVGAYVVIAYAATAFNFLFEAQEYRRYSKRAAAERGSRLFAEWAEEHRASARHWRQVLPYAPVYYLRWARSAWTYFGRVS